MSRTLARSVLTSLAALAFVAPLAAVQAAPLSSDNASQVTAQNLQTSEAARNTLNTSALDNRLRDLVKDDVVGAVSAAHTTTGHWAYTAGDVANKHNNFLKAFATSRAASVTKPIVATLILQGVDDGRWTLDTKVNNITPGLLPGHDDVTLRMLLSHTSGLPDYLGMPEFEAGLLSGIEAIEDIQAVTSKKYTNTQLLEIGLSRTWRFTPGTKFNYSNSNYVALSEILERTHKKPLGQIAWGKIFAPLGMWRSSIPTTPRLDGAHLSSTMYQLDKTSQHTHFNPTIFSGAGALVSTPSDLNTFHKALATGKLISPKLVEEMRTPSGVNPVYGLGMFRVVDPCSSKENPTFLYGHDGAGFGEWAMSAGRPDGSGAFTTLWTGRRYDENWAGSPRAGFEAYFDIIAKTCATDETNQRSAAAAPQVHRDEFLKTLNDISQMRNLPTVAVGN